MEATTKRWSHAQTYGPSLDDLLIEIAEIFSVDIVELCSPDRSEELLFPRIVYTYAALTLTNAPTRLIARPIRKERSNISHHKMEVKNWISTKDDLWFKYWNKYIHNSKLWKEYSNK